MEIKSLNCPNCSAPLSPAPGETALHCSHCGSDLRLSSGGEASLSQLAPPSGPPGLDMAEVQRLMQANHKISAIKLVRLQTDMGLKEAKDFVEALEAGTPLPYLAPRYDDDPIPDPGAGDSPDWPRIRQELAHGRKIEAIKLYREQTGVGLKEAKDAVEMFERGQTPPPPSIPAPAPAIPGHVNLDEIRQLLAAGNKIEAVKRYREQTGAGLKESLDIIDAMPEARTALGGATGGGCGGCIKTILALAFIILLLPSGCGLYVQITDEYACGMDVLTHNREVVQRLGEPVETLPVVFLLGYSSSSDFGGNSSVDFAMYTLVSGANDRSWVYMEISHNDGSPYYMNANLFHDGDDIRVSGSVLEDDCTP